MCFSFMPLISMKFSCPTQSGNISRLDKLIFIVNCSQSAPMSLTYHKADSTKGKKATTNEQTSNDTKLELHPAITSQIYLPSG